MGELLVALSKPEVHRDSSFNALACPMDFFVRASYGLLSLGKRMMEKLKEVETARALMTEAVAWSVMKWLREKKRVRKAADQANGVLDKLSQAIKEQWTEGLRAAYEALAESKSSGSTRAAAKEASQTIDPNATLVAKKIKEADEQAYRARMKAEETFDKAERQLSTSLAREGCRQAIDSWDLYEKAIHKAAILIHPK
jgi:hypothetical protein